MKILVCVDGSEQSQRALEEAIKIAQERELEKALIIYVASTPSTVPEVYSRQFIELEKELEKKVREKGEEILSQAQEEFKKNGLEADTILQFGHPSETITRVASEQEIDLIVIGSRGLGGLKALLLGSVSNAVAQKTSSNVLIVKK